MIKEEEEEEEEDDVLSRLPAYSLDT